jgi:hypothetical protein
VAGRPSWEDLPRLIIENKWTVEQAAKQMACGTNHIVASLQTALGQGSAQAGQALTAMRAAAAELGPAAGGVGATLAAAGATTMPAWLLPAIVVGVIAAGVYGVTQWGTPSSDPIERSDAVSEQIDRREGLEEGEAQEPLVVIPGDAGAGQNGYYLVTVATDGNPIYSVRSQQSVDSGDLLTCQFLNGGRCAGSIVDTPNGPVEAGADIPAVFLSKTLFTDDDDSVARTDAWTELCARLTGIRVAPLAAGYIGLQGGQVYTIDEANWVSPNPNPCGFL